MNDDGGATIDDPEKIDTHTWTVTVSDTFPGWIGYITVTHANTGTVPLKFDTFQVLSLTGPNALRQAYTLKFYPGPYGSPGTANIWGTLVDFQTLQYYDSWIGPYEIKMASGDTHDSLVSLELSSDVTDFYNTAVTFTFRMTAVQTTL